MEEQIVVFEGKGARRPRICQETFHAPCYGFPGRVKAGMDEGYFQRTFPLGESDMVNPISLYTYYCYYGRTEDTVCI